VDESILEERVRTICLALPEATERASHGSPAFFVGKQFAMLWINGHHDHHFPHLWCAAAFGVQEELIGRSPDRFFRPPYVGSRGWIAVRLDDSADFNELAMLLHDAYRCVATKRQVALLDGRDS
jgi:hypothetical protein